MVGPFAPSTLAFCNRRRDRVKLLFFNRSGFVLILKRLTIQRYGIYNPYTGRGAIEGLLPHGPRNVRDVLATHILKQTGSYEQASYAIQDTPDMVARHCGRFLPLDKAALAAKILNQVWQAA
ncbi:IS66 Orf2 like protein [Rhizobium sp. PP-CC-3A-592]|nr:IS66 Orf2 like protein [Rhizobium sp. PP-CC-3A-592]